MQLKSSEGFKKLYELASTYNNMMDAIKGNKSNERMKKVWSFYYSVLWGRGLTPSSQINHMEFYSFSVLLLLSLSLACFLPAFLKLSCLSFASGLSSFYTPFFTSYSLAFCVAG